jgi:hypothetical protein
MQTTKEVEEQFKEELRNLLVKWGATVEADDHYQNRGKIFA